MSFYRTSSENELFYSLFLYYQRCIIITFMDRILDMLFSFLPEPDSFTLLESFPLNLRFPF